MIFLSHLTPNIGRCKYIDNFDNMLNHIHCPMLSTDSRFWLAENREEGVGGWEGKGVNSYPANVVVSVKRYHTAEFYRVYTTIWFEGKIACLKLRKRLSLRQT